MECPRCSGFELQELLTEDEVAFGHCETCHNIWIDSGELTRALLRANLPGLDSLGGRANLGESSGTCPEDLTDLVVIEAPRDPDTNYAMCDVCGGIWLFHDDERFDTPDPKAIMAGILDHFRYFHTTTG